MKQEVRRGRKFVEYHDPETQDEHTFTQEISGADVSYQDETGNWHPADENWATDGVDGFIFKNDKLNHKVRLKGTGGRTWYPRRNVNTEYMTFGVPQYFDGKRWKNFGFSGWGVEGKTITLNTRQGVTILVHNRWNGIKIDWILANSTAPSRMRYAVTLTGITYVDGIIYGADGTRLGQLTPTTATDVNGAELVCSGSYASGYVEFQADVTGAVYPVTIDPDFATTSTAGDNLLQSTKPTRNYGGLTIVSFILSAFVNIMRFDCSSIDSSAVCSEATLSLTKTNAGTSRAATVTIHSIAAANSDWIEGTGTGIADAASGESCYNALAADGSGGVTTAWAGSAGLNTSGTDYEATAIGSFDGDRADVAGTVESASLTTTRIAGWFGSTNTNYGLRLQSSGNYSEFASSENATESYRPVLTVTYTAGTTGVPKHFLHYARLRSN